MPSTEQSHSQTQINAGVDDAPVLSENCYHAVIGDRKRGEVLPGKLSLSRLSFRWQVSLLGTLVVVLSLAVLFAIVATLRYTKSAVLSGEKKRLAETARSLAQEYEDRADSPARIISSLHSTIPAPRVPRNCCLSPAALYCKIWRELEEAFIRYRATS